MKSRRIVPLAGLTAAALALAACSGNTASPSGGDPEVGELTITWQTAGKAGIEALIDAFEDEYPDAKVTAEFVETSTYFSLLRTQLQGGSAADIFWVNPGNGNPVAVEVLADYLVDLSGEGWVGDVYDDLVRYTKVDDKTLILPTDVTAFGAVYNDQAVEAAGLSIPTTWDEVLQFCEDARAQGLTAYSMGAQDLFETQGFVLTSVPSTVYAEDPEFDEELAAGETSFPESEGWQKTLDRYVEALEAGCYNDEATGTSFNQSIENIAGGKALGATDAYLIAQFAQSLNPDSTYTLAPFPVTLDADEAWMAVAPMSGFAINSRSDNVELARTFLDFAAQNLDLYAASGGGSIPAIPSGEPIDDPNLALIEDYLLSGRSITFVDQLWPNPEVQSAMYAQLQSMINGSATPDQVLEAMQGAY
ncbi:ABC transporter substrate-binding protein [Microbacterium sp. F51-2R]|uniref:ABC transporter substrate-binding protein n=1 Tax=Microbacterium sp. F51-2R TaxID=3445777 RepID=UPI003F9F185D